MANLTKTNTPDRYSLDFDIQRSRIAYNSIFPSPYAILNHRYCVIGNGYDWVTRQGKSYQVEIDEKIDRKLFPKALSQTRRGQAEIILRSGVPAVVIDPHPSPIFRPRQDVVSLAGGRVTYDTLEKLTHYYPLSKDYALLWEIAEGKAQGLTGTVQADLVIGALAVCDLILEASFVVLGPEDYDPYRGFNINLNEENAAFVREQKPRILERYYGPDVWSYLIQITEDDYLFDEPIESAMRWAQNTNSSLYPMLTLAHHEHWSTLWPEGYAGKSYQAYLPQMLLDQIAARREVSWILFYYEDSVYTRAQIEDSGSATFLPYLSDLVAVPTQSYLENKAVDEALRKQEKEKTMTLYELIRLGFQRIRAEETVTEYLTGIQTQMGVSDENAAIIGAVLRDGERV